MADTVLYHVAERHRAYAAKDDHHGLTLYALPKAYADAHVLHSSHDWLLFCYRRQVLGKGVVVLLALGSLVDRLIVMFSEHVLLAELLNGSIPSTSTQ